MTAPTPDRPLVTFALFAYNQEKYIRAAVEGAFSQTYSPLEIILSDDCSSDRTFEIMQEMAAAYEGPHEVKLVRRIKNLGIAFHVNKVFEEAAGKYVVLAAGDDVSCPDRTRIAVENLIEDSAALFYSDVTPVGGTLGFAIEDLALSDPTDLSALALSRKLYIGATGVIEKSFFQKYGPLKSRNLYEDQVLGFRAALEGRVSRSTDRLVSYRIGGVSKGVRAPLQSVADYKNRRIASIQRNIDMFFARLDDIGKSDHAGRHDLIAEINREIARLEAEARALKSPVGAMMEGRPVAGAREGLKIMKAFVRSFRFSRSKVSG